MNNLQTIIVIAAVLAVPVSIWAIIYFSARIITQHRITRDLGNMPSQEELRAWYEQNNSVLPAYLNHLPTREHKREQRKSTL
jgi:hypothetical protein